MNIHQLSVEAAIASLQSSPDGLSADEARRRLLEFGPNRIERLEREPLALRFLLEFTHFFAIILWVAALLAFLAELNDPGSGMGTLGAAIVAVILVNGVFSFWQEYRAEEALRALQQLLPGHIKALRDGTVMKVPAEDIAPGDVIFLEAGDDVPADCRLIQCFGVRTLCAGSTLRSVP